MPVIRYHAENIEEGTPERFELARQDSSYLEYAANKLGELCLTLGVDRAATGNRIYLAGKLGDAKRLYGSGVVASDFGREIDDVEQAVALSKEMIDLNPEDIRGEGIHFIIEAASEFGDHYTETGLALVDEYNQLLIDVHNPITITADYTPEDVLNFGGYWADFRAGCHVREIAYRDRYTTSGVTIEPTYVYSDEQQDIISAPSRKHASLGYMQGDRYVPSVTILSTDHPVRKVMDDQAKPTPVTMYREAF